MKQFPTVITGADGYVGTILTAELVKAQTPVCAWLRASNDAELAEKKQSMLARLRGYGCRPAEGVNIQFVGGALEENQPFVALRKNDVRTFIHSAAVTRFNVDAETARTVNREGATRALEFAASCAGLDRFLFISTLYSSGLSEGKIDECAFDNNREFANHYERSKWESEQVLLSNYADLPWQIARVGTIIADNCEGRVTQQNAFHNTLKLVYYGLLSVMPGRAQTPLYLVPGDLVSGALCSLAHSSQCKRVYHICYGRDESARLDDLLRVAFDVFEEDQSFKRRRVLKPLYADIQSFSILAQTMEALGQGVMSQALASVSPFAKQLFVDKDIVNENFKSIFPSYRAPEPSEFIEKTCRYLVNTKWGKVVEHAQA